MSFLVQKKAKETAKEVVKKATTVSPNRYRAGLYSPRSPKKGMTRYEWQQTRNGKTTTKTYDLKDPDTWTDTDLKKLDTSINDLIKIRLAQGEWTFFHTLTDFLFDWTLIAGGTMYLQTKLKNTEQEELDRLTYYSMLEAGLMTPVYPTTEGGHAFVGAKGSFGESEEEDTSWEYEWWKIEDPESEGSKTETQLDYSPANVETFRKNGVKVDESGIDENVDYDNSIDSVYIQGININPTGKPLLGSTVVVDFKDSFVNLNQELYLDMSFYYKEDNCWCNWANVIVQNANKLEGYEGMTTNFMLATSSAFKTDMNFDNLEGLYNGQEVEMLGNNYPVETLQHFKQLKRIVINLPKTEDEDVIIQVESDFGATTTIQKVTEVQSDFNWDSLDISVRHISSPDEQPIEVDTRVYHFDETSITRSFEPVPQRNDVEIKPSELEDPTTGTVTLPTPNNIPVKVPGHNENFYVKPDNEGKLGLIGEQSGDEPTIDEEDAEDLVILDPIEQPKPDANYPEFERPPDPDPSNPGDGSGGDGGGSGGGEEGASCEVNRDFDGFKELGDTFTHKFPFSIPFDIYRLFEAIFGDMGSERPQFTYPVGDTEFEIGIPAFFDRWMPFARSMLLIIFDIGLIYAVRKMMGGNQG